MTWDNRTVNSVGEKTDRGHLATTRILTRILICLKETPGMVQSQISGRVRAGSLGRLKDALIWLHNHKLIECRQRIDGCSKCYYLTENEEI